MAIVQSSWGAGLHQAPVSGEAGTVVAERYSFTITDDLDQGDIIELAVLPAYHTVVDAILISSTMTTTTLDVGIMSGAVGSTDQSRTSGDELFDGAATGSVVRMSAPAGFRIAPVEADRSIGVKVVTADITASGQVVDLILFTKQ